MLLIDRESRCVLVTPADLHARRLRPLPGLLQHPRGNIQPGEAIPTTREFNGMSPGATADIQHGRARTQAQRLDQEVHLRNRVLREAILEVIRRVSVEELLPLCL